jgi:acetyl-CoA synthetase
VTVREGYGQSDTTALIGTSPGLPRVAGRVGKPLPGYRLTLLAEDGSPNAEQGEICVDTDTERPVGLMTGYLDDEGRMRPADQAGRYRTGDIGIRDHDGYIRLLGRTDDMFESFDHRISPYELEAVLRTHPLVRDAAVIPAPHPVGGATPHAVVELVAAAPQEQATARRAAVRTAARQRAAPGGPPHPTDRNNHGAISSRPAGPNHRKPERLTRCQRRASPRPDHCRTPSGNGRGTRAARPRCRSRGS